MRRYLLACTAIGAESDLARAKVFDINPKTIGEARRGAVIGPRFICNTITVMRRHAAALAEIGMKPSLDEFFEVVGGDE